MINRRSLLASGASTGVAGLLLVLVPGRALSIAPKPISLPDAAWRKRLSPPAYAVLRQEATEAPFTSPLNNEHRAGTFRCAGCALPLYSSTTKFDSGTGWPSFWTHLPDAIGTKRDTSIGSLRTEVHCARCGGHLGHVFEDGPKPTGLRYCMNGVAMAFAPAGRA